MTWDEWKGVWKSLVMAYWPRQPDNDPNMKKVFNILKGPDYTVSEIRRGIDAYVEARDPVSPKWFDCKSFVDEQRTTQVGMDTWIGRLQADDRSTATNVVTHSRRIHPSWCKNMTDEDIYFQWLKQQKPKPSNPDLESFVDQRLAELRPTSGDSRRNAKVFGTLFREWFKDRESSPLLASVTAEAIMAGSAERSTEKTIELDDVPF